MMDPRTLDVLADDRLLRLPAKTRRAFADLLRRGFMSNETAELLLMATELGGEPRRLLGFAIGMLDMERSGVPVRDAIRMARQQGRRVNLSWGPGRWQREHDRMARVAALTRLTLDSRHYDVRAFERHLPATWPGYLIRTSRRLGMEGARQRHRVASKDQALRERRRAIAVVFLNRRRWTVELALRCSDDAPLQIMEIRSRFNRLPTRVEREAIHAVLGIPTPAPGQARDAAAEPRWNTERLRRLLPAMRERGIILVSVCFGGSGDDGQVDAVRYTPDPPFGNREPIIVPCEMRRARRDGDRWVTDRVTELVELEAAIKEVAGQYLETVDVNWDISDGGTAELEIDVGVGTMELSIDQHYVERDNLYCRQVEIDTGRVLS